MKKPRPTQSLLLVEPDDAAAAGLARSARGVADVHRHARFESARSELLSAPFSLIATNLRLPGFDGLHLVRLAGTAAIPARAIVYTDRYEPALAQEVQRAGAFYETRDYLRRALAAYLRGALPPEDRRDPGVRDRRRRRGTGRRCWDQSQPAGISHKRRALRT